MFQGITPSSLVTGVFATPTPHVLLPSSHPLAGRTALGLAELAAEPFILIDATPSRDFVMGAFRAVGVEPRVRFRSANLSMIRGLVARGLGYTLIVQGPRRDNVPGPDGVVAIPLTDELRTDAMVLAHLPEVQLTKRAQAFWDYAMTAIPR